MTKLFLHQLSDAKALFEVVANDRQLQPSIVEKDYWVMHCLWGLKLQGIQFELKGGTSLTKGFGIIERFSEDIDIQIHPQANMDVKTGKNQDKPSQIASRKKFFDLMANTLKVEGIIFNRDEHFDDAKKCAAVESGAITKHYFLFQLRLKKVLF